MAVREGLDILLLGTACEALAATLRQRRHRVFPISRTEAAAAMLTVRSFDVIVVTSQLADMGVADAVIRLRGGISATIAVTPLIVCGASGRDAERALTNGADHILDEDGAIDWLAGRSHPSDEDMNDPRVGVAPPDTAAGHNLLRLLGETLGQQLAALDPRVFQPAHLADIAHRLKGSAANFGYTSLGTAAKEAMRNSHDKDRMIDLTAQLRQEIEKAMIDINQKLSRSGK